MQLPHPLDDRLVGLLVARVVEGRVLLRQLVEARAHLLEVGLGFGLDRDFDDRVRKLHALQHDRRLLVAQRLARDDVLQAADGDDVPRASGLDVDALVGVHEQQAADALLAPLVGVQDEGAGLQDARVDADEREGADELVGHDFEREAREGFGVRRLARHLDRRVVHVRPLHRGHILG